MKIIFVKNKEWGEYPFTWTPLYYIDGEFYLGGGRSTPAVLVKDSKEAKRVMYHARKQLERFNLIYYTVNVKRLTDILYCKR